MNRVSRPAASPAGARLFYGWYMVAACAVVAFYAWGLGFYGLGVYLNVFHRQYGWSVGFISLTVTGYYLAGAAALVPLGSVIDRHGPRGVLASGCLVMGASVAALGFVTARWQLAAVYLVMSTGWASMSTTAISGTLLPWFNRRRGRALTLALCGASLGGMAIVPLLVALTQAYGFRVATSLAALLLWASVLPLAVFVIKRRPEDLGLLPDGASEHALTRSCREAAPGTEERLSAGSTGPPQADDRRESAPEEQSTSPRGANGSRIAALRSPLFWTILLPFALALVAQVGFLVHQLTFLAAPLGRSQAAFVISLTTLAALAGRLAVGFALDSVDTRLSAAGCFAMQGLGLLLMAAVSSPAALYAGSILLGLGVGVVITLPPLLVHEEFGALSFGAIFALASAGMQIGVAAGSSVVGVARDHWGSYPSAWWLLVALEALAAVLVLAGRRLRPTF